MPTTIFERQNSAQPTAAGPRRRGPAARANRLRTRRPLVRRHDQRAVFSPQPEDTAARTLTIHQALQAVRAEIGPVGKHGRNEEAGYDFRSLDDIVDACSGPFQKYGVLAVPKITQADYEQNGSWTTARLHITYSFVGLTGDRVKAYVVGEATDNSDKATNKAMSAAFKYALVQVLMIRSAAVEDSDRHHPQQRKAAPQRPASGADWCFEQLKRQEVWYSAARLAALHDWARLEGLLEAPVPGELPNTRLGAFIADRRDTVAAEEKQRAERRAKEKGEAGARIRTENPNPPGHDDRWATRRPSGTPHGPARKEEAPGAQQAPRPPARPTPSSAQPGAAPATARSGQPEQARHEAPPPAVENAQAEGQRQGAVATPPRRPVRGAKKLLLDEAAIQAAILALPIDAYLLPVCEPDRDPATLQDAQIKTFVTGQRARVIARLVELGHQAQAGRYADLAQTAPVSLPHVVGWSLEGLGITPVT